MGMKEALSYVSFMLMGHTKFAPDQLIQGIPSFFSFNLYKSFGYSRASYKLGTDCSTAHVAGKKLATLVSQFFYSIPDITLYHNVRSHLMQITHKQYSNSSDEPFKVLKTSALISYPKTFLCLDLKGSGTHTNKITIHYKSTPAANITCTRSSLYLDYRQLKCKCKLWLVTHLSQILLQSMTGNGLS